MSTTRKELTEKMEELTDELATCEKTKASGLRARKLTNEITKMMKKFRSENVEFHKN